MVLPKPIMPQSPLKTSEHIFGITISADHRFMKITDGLDVVFSRFGWVSFTITLRQAQRSFAHVGLKLQDRKSLFYADCAKLLLASASGLLWTSFIQFFKRRHLVSDLLFLLIYAADIVLSEYTCLTFIASLNIAYSELCVQSLILRNGNYFLKII